MYNSIKDTKSFADRRAGDAANTAANNERLAAVIAKSDADVRDARENFEALKLAMAATSEAEDKRLEEAFARDAFDAFTPILKGYGDAPRTTAGKVAEVFRALESRGLTELGSPIDASFLGRCFAFVGGFDGEQGNLNFWLSNTANAPLDASYRATTAIRENAPLVSIDSAIRELEESIAIRAHQTACGDLERSKAYRSRASARGLTLARMDFDIARDLELKAADIARHEVHAADMQRREDAGELPGAPRPESMLAIPSVQALKDHFVRLGESVPRF